MKYTAIPDETVADLMRVTGDTAAREAFNARLRKMEGSGAISDRISIVPAYDFIPGSYGARVTVWRHHRQCSLVFYGAPTAEKLFSRLEKWCTEESEAWMTAQLAYIHGQEKLALRCGVSTALQVAQAAAPLYHAAARLVGDCDNSIADEPKPQEVQRWLDENNHGAIPRGIISDIYGCHLGASKSWAHLIVSEFDRQEKVE